MSHFKACDPEKHNAELPGSMEDSCLSVRTGKMSFIQFGFRQDPGEKETGKFQSDRVVLLVLNDHRNVQYQIENGNEVLNLNSQQLKDHVCILWPKGEAVPVELSPEYLFGHRSPGTRGQGERIWPRESYTDDKGIRRDWDAALVFRDPSNQYAYEYRTSVDEYTDDYRFALESEEIVAWLWEKDESAPTLLLPEGQTVTRALQAESGGAQGAGGALPYPPG